MSVRIGRHITPDFRKLATIRGSLRLRLMSCRRHIGRCIIYCRVGAEFGDEFLAARATSAKLVSLVLSPSRPAALSAICRTRFCATRCRERSPGQPPAPDLQAPPPQAVGVRARRGLAVAAAVRPRPLDNCCDQECSSPCNHQDYPDPHS